MSLPAPLQNYANQRADFYGLPRDLYNAVIQQESGGNIHARSPAGAVGPAQLMPGTAHDLGVDPNDPYQNLDGGAKYLAQLLKKFGGNIALALSAYNSGPGGSESKGQVENNPETQNYVDSILGTLSGNRSIGDTIGDMFIYGHDQATDPNYKPNAVESIIDFFVNLFSKDTLVRTVAIIVGIILLSAAVFTFIAQSKAGRIVNSVANKAADLAGLPA